MLPLLARKRSGKSRWRQERFVNKSPRPAVIEGYMRWRSVHGHGREAVGMLRACVRSRLVTLMVAIASLWLLGWPEGRGVPTSSAQEAKSSPQIWTVPEIGALPNDANGRLVRRGRDLVTATYAHIGPEVADGAKRFAGNNLACGNCHLQAGNEEVRHPAVRPVRKISPLQRAPGGGDDHRGAAQCLHDAQHERARVAGGWAGDASPGGLHQIPVDRRRARAAVAGSGHRQNA